MPLSPTAPPANSLQVQALWSFTPTIASLVMGMVSIPIFLRFLGDEKYALWFYVMSISGLLGFADLGMGVSVGKYLGGALGRKDTLAVREYWGTGHALLLGIVCAVALAFSLVGIFAGPLWFQGGREHIRLLQICFLLGGLNLLATFYLQLWTILSQCFLDFAFIGTLRTAGGIANSLFCMLASILTHNPAAVMAASLGVCVLQILTCICHAWRHYQLAFNVQDFRLARFHEIKAYSAKIVLNILCSFAGGLDKVLLGRLASPRDFTLYNIAFNASSRVQSLGNAIMSPVFHNTTRRMECEGLAGARAVYEEAAFFLFRYLLHGALLLAVWQVPLLSAWLGPHQAAGILPLFYPLFISCLIGAYSLVASGQMPALHQVHRMTAFQLGQNLAAAGGVILGWVLFGLQGVAYGILLSRIVSLAQDFTFSRWLQTPGIWSQRGLHQCLIQIPLAGIFFMIFHALSWGPAWFLPFLVHATTLPLWDITRRRR